MEVLAPLFAEYDFFDDVPFRGLFRELAEMFPNSRFILTHPTPQDWWTSVWGHWRKWDSEGSPHHKLLVFEAIQYHLPVGAAITGTDRSKLIAKYVTHTQLVQNYLSGLDDYWQQT